jgi:hypothetical protein
MPNNQVFVSCNVNRHAIELLAAVASYLHWNIEVALPRVFGNTKSRSTIYYRYTEGWQSSALALKFHHNNIIFLT